MNLHHLVYLSECARHVNIETEAKVLSDKSRIKNAQSGISGMLLFGHNHFLQLLEGDRDALYRCYGRIATDRRHYNISILVSQPAKAPLLGEEPMEFRTLSDTLLKEMADLLTWKRILSTSPHGTALPADTILNFFIRLRFLPYLENQEQPRLKVG